MGVFDIFYIVQNQNGAKIAQRITYKLVEICRKILKYQ